MPDLSRDTAARLDQALEEFAHLQQAFIDASSLIYTRKCGFLTPLAETLSLQTIPGVLAETGWPELPISIYHQAGAGEPTDDLLLRAALQEGLPVISEDKKILTRVISGGLACFNAVMMLHFLYYKKVLDAGRHNACLEKLKGIARYSPGIWEFSGRVFTRVAKLRHNPPA